MRGKPSRREFLGISLGLAGVAQISRAPQKQAGGAGRRLALSVRVAEAFDSKEKTTMSIDELVKLAKSNGYGALCMRASQGGIHSPRSLIAEMRRKIDEAGLVVSMVTGDFAVPSNNDQGPEGLRHITPYLDLAQAFGADLIRVCMKKEEDIAWARKASDEARERKMRLAHQSHCASLFETVNGSLQTLRAVARPNFGIIYEPANWMIAREDYGPETIKKLQPHLFNAYVQNHRLARDGKTSVMTWKLGAVPLDHIGLWEKGGVDWEAVFAGLDAIHYRGFVTVHQAFAGIMAVDEAARKSAEYLRTFRPKS